MKEVTNLVPHYIMLAIFFGVGALCFIAALSNFKWFFNSSNVAFLRKYIKNPQYIRLIYAVIGIVLMCLALYFYYTLKKAMGL